MLFKGQYKVPFMLYVDFENILKLVDKRYKEKMNQWKLNSRGKTAYTEKNNTHALAEWCAQNTFAHEDILDLLEKFHCKDSV